MASNQMIIKVSFDFTQLETLFREYVAEKPADDGEVIVGQSYREVAREFSDDFLAWLKRRPAQHVEAKSHL